jgi:hypothetical protein
MGEQFRAQMGLGEVEMQAGEVEREAVEAVGLGGEEGGEGGALDPLDRAPGLAFVHAALLVGAKPRA